MDGKKEYKKRTALSEGRAYLREQVSSSSAAGSYRKGKLCFEKSTATGRRVLENTAVRSDDTEGDENPAGEAVHYAAAMTESTPYLATKEMQKRRIKKRQVIETQKKRVMEDGKRVFSVAKKVREKMAGMTEQTGRWMADHSLPILSVAIIAVIVLGVIGGLSSCSMLIGSFHGSTVTTTFTAEDREILAVEESYRELEEMLGHRLEQIETVHPGYDEYVYVLDEVGHDPYALASLLTVLYEAYTKDTVTETLNALLDAQYILTLTEKEEIRMRMETKIVWEEQTRMEERQGTRLTWDEVMQAYVEEAYTYEVEVSYWEEVEYEEETEYPCLLLQVQLKNRSINAVLPTLGLTEEQQKRYALLMIMKGNKSYLF